MVAVAGNGALQWLRGGACSFGQSRVAKAVNQQRPVRLSTPAIHPDIVKVGSTSSRRAAKRATPLQVTTRSHSFQPSAPPGWCVASVVSGTLSTANCSGLPALRGRAHFLPMGTKSRETIYGASIRAAAERATEARKEADRLACEAWNKRMLGFQGPAQPSPALGDALNAGYSLPRSEMPWMQHASDRCAGHRAPTEDNAGP